MFQQNVEGICGILESYTSGFRPGWGSGMGVELCPDTQERMFLFPYILKIPHENSECSVLCKKVTPAVGGSDCGAGRRGGEQLHMARMVHCTHEGDTMEIPRRIILLNTLYFLLLVQVIKFMTTFSHTCIIRYNTTACYSIIIIRYISTQRISLKNMSLILYLYILICPCKGLFFTVYGVSKSQTWLRNFTSLHFTSQIRGKCQFLNYLICVILRL